MMGTIFLENNSFQLIGFVVLMTGQALYNDIGCTALEKKCCPKIEVVDDSEHTISMRKRISNLEA